MNLATGQLGSEPLVDIGLARPRLTTRVFTGKQGLGALAPDWTRLLAEIDRPRFYQLPAWWQAYLEALEPNERSLHFLGIYSDAGLVGVFPLKRSVTHILGVPFRRLHVPQHSNMPFCDFVYARTERNRGLAHLVLAQLRAHPQLGADFLFLPRTLEGSVALHAAGGHRGWRCLVEPRRAWNYLPCDSVQAVQERLSPKFKRNLRNRMKRLSRHDDVRFSSVQVAGPPMQAAFEHFLDVEASGWKGASGAQTAIKLNADLRGLYGALVEHFSALGACEINLLHIGGRCIAGQLCLVVDDTCYLLVLGYDEAYANLSPGVLLTHSMIMRHAASERVRFIDLFGDADWHRDWEPLRQEFSRCYFFDETLRGRAAYLLMLMRRRLRPAYLRYFKPVRRTVGSWLPERAP